MGFISGKWSPLPWNDAFDRQLQQFSEKTYRYEGSEIQHEIHKMIIEAHWINLRLYYSLRRRFAYLIGLQCLMFAFLLIR